ncbi:MAG: hypothetical protein IJ532_04515 [Alphaproteobacteria bacterium]|nr:hypothetical protein [Alphaproteobacteria bacterium]
MKKIFAFFCFILISFQAEAKLDYAVPVPVDVEAENSVVAKEKAMRQAQRQAFLDVAGKLTSEENVQKLSELSDDKIMRFVQSVSVADEKSGGTKYIANLTVQINEQLLKDYMAENEMIKSDAQEMLVIPVFKKSPRAYPLLWEGDNVWRQNWRSKGLIKFGVMQLRTIGEHFRNIDDLNADNALYMSSSLYEKISEMNGSDQVYVILAEVMENGDLKVTVKNEKNKTEESFAVYNDGESNVFDKAIEKSVMYISNMEREVKNNENKGGISKGAVNAVYVYQNVKDWLIKSRTIEAMEQVEKVETKSFGGGKVNFVIHYTGSPDDLWLSLQEEGFSHEPEENYYIIR